MQLMVWNMLQGEAGKQERLWVLKEDAHRGEGVLVVPEAEALARAGAARLDGALEMVQAYLGEQYTVAGRRFYLRCWLSPSGLPLATSFPSECACKQHATLNQVFLQPVLGSA